MLHRSLVTAGELKYFQPHKPQKVIERAAHYTQGSSLGWLHFHSEANYRKTHLGWKAYAKENMDIFGQNIPYPVRHFEGKLPGMWMGGCHHNPKHWGAYNWKMARKWWLVTYGGAMVPMLTFYKRMKDNGFEQKNMGAVFGMD